MSSSDLQTLCSRRLAQYGQILRLDSFARCSVGDWFPFGVFQLLGK